MEAMAKKRSKGKQKGLVPYLLGWAKSIALALVLWFILQALVIKSFRIDSGSMEPALFEGDFLFINRAVYGARIPFTPWWTPAFREPERGELIVLRGVEAPILTIVKRVIGTAGDTLEMRNDSLFRNGTYTPEPYAQYVDSTVDMDAIQRSNAMRWQVPHLVNGDVASYRPGLRTWGPVVVPPEHLFTMGDNRDASYDGRHWGFLPSKNLLGHPVFIYFSFDPQHWRPLPFITAIRWGRLFSSPD